MRKNSLFITFVAAIAVVASTLIPIKGFSGDLPSEWRAPYAAVYKQLEDNLKKPNGKNPFFHAQPAPKYPGVYLWDSSFISLIWLKKDQNTAKDIIKSVLHNQLPDGRVPHVVSLIGKSQWTQPPVLGWAASRIAAETGDVEFVRAVYPKLRRYHQWLNDTRRHPSGLYFWAHAYESGIDNSPRFGKRDESKYIDTREVAAIDLSSYMVLDSRALASMARMISLGSEADAYEKEAESTAALIRANLWDESTGYFYDRYVTTGEFIKIPTMPSFFPMVAKVATQEQAARLVQHLQNPAEFNTPIPFPTVARNHPKFEKDCWRGPVWINTAYLGLQGLKAYGYDELEKQMAYRLVDGVYKTWNNTHKFVEYYDPERYDFDKLTRKRGTGLFDFLYASKNPLKVLEHLILKQMILGTKPVDHFVGWTGLVNTIVLEDLAGNPKPQ